MSQGDLFDDGVNKELERLADEFDRNDDYLLEKELESQGGKSFNPAGDEHPLFKGFDSKTGRYTKGYDTNNYWEGAFGSRGGYYDSWTVTPVKSASQYLRDSYWSSGYSDYYTKKNDNKQLVHESLHEVLKELNKTINLTSNTINGEETLLKVKYSNGSISNDFESDTLYVSPNIILKDDENVKTGDAYYESLDGMNGQAMLCAFMKKGIHSKANVEYKECKDWAPRNIFNTDVQASAAAEIFSKWPGFTSYITSQMQVFGVQKDHLLKKFEGEIILLDDLVETLCYNRLASEKVDYTIFHPDVVKKMLLADKDFNEMMDMSCKDEDRFQKAVRIYENVRDILNLDKKELEQKWSESGMQLPENDNESSGSGSGDTDESEGEQEVGNPSASNKIEDKPSDNQRRFTGDNSYNNNLEVEGDIVFNILDHNKKLRERLKELEDKLVSELKDDQNLNNPEINYKLMIPPVNAETVKEYDDYVRANRKNISSLKDSFLFHNNMCNQFSYGLNDGDIDEHALYKVVMGDCERIYERRDVISEKSYHISLVIDQSGSMSGQRLDEASKLSILFAEALKYLRKTEYSIYGFETREINTWVYKDKMYDKQKALIKPESNGGTAMCYHLAAIGDKVINQYGDFDNKFMFIICDGQPTSGMNGMNSNKATAYVIDKLRKKGIKVYGIGICNAFTDGVGSQIFGEGNFTVIGDVASSLNVLTNRLRKYLQKASKVG